MVPPKNAISLEIGILGNSAMIKVISVWIDGDVETLMRYWQAPEGVRLDRKKVNKLRLSFVDEQVQEFYRLEQIVQQQNVQIALKPVFQAHSFRDDELLQADLLSWTGAVDEHIEVLRTPSSEGAPLRLVRHSGENQLPRVFFTVNGPTICHKDMIDDMNRLNVLKGAVVEQCVIEGQDLQSDDWFALSSSADLGNPFLERRFVPAFSRANWHGEDVCYSSTYVPEMLYIAQGIFRYLCSLPEYQQLQFALRPIDLV